MLFRLLPKYNKFLVELKVYIFPTLNQLNIELNTKGANKKKIIFTFYRAAFLKSLSAILHFLDVFLMQVDIVTTIKQTNKKTIYCAALHPGRNWF